MVALLAASTCFAQIQKGAVQLGGEVRIFNNSVGDFSRSQFAFTPQAALFLSDNTSLGLQLGYSTTRNDIFDVNLGRLVQQRNNVFTLGTYARFHKSMAENLYVFLQPAVAVGFGKVEQEGMTDEPDINVFDANVGIGATYFVTPKFAVEVNMAALGFNRQETVVQGFEQTQENFFFNVDFSSIGLGLSYYIK